MERHNLHLPAWTHLHKPNWYELGARFDHLIHDPRFWAVVALAVLAILGIVTVMFTEPTATTTNPMSPGLPVYPYIP